jgi:O-antigen/teichoic acid export membrane protein
MIRNFGYTAVSVFSRLLVGLLLFLLLARLWGPTQFGLFTFTFSVAALLVLLVDFGFGLYILREVAAQPAHAATLIAEAFRAKLALVGVIVFVATGLSLVAGPASPPLGLAVPLLVAALATSFSDLFVAPLRALGRFDIETGVVTLANAVQFSLAGAVAWNGGTPVMVAWAMVLSRLAYLALALAMVYQVVPQLNLRRPVAVGPRATLRRAWPYGVDGMLATASNQLDVVAVRLLFGTQAVGLYSAGQKICMGAGALAPVVAVVMLPRMTGLAASGNPTFWRTALKTGALMAGIGICFASPLIAFPDEIALVLFGGAYAQLSALLPWFGVILLARYINTSTGVATAAAGLQTKRALAQAVGVSFFVLSCGLLAFIDRNITYLLLALLSSILLTAFISSYHLWKLRKFSHLSPR